MCVEPFPRKTRSSRRAGPADLTKSRPLFLKFLNGDPRGPLVHHETGCCSSIEETKQGMRVAILGAGMLFG
eukprot:4977379-Lingulodinium_polyedra.AAC.1